jgi:hypothetical protein
MLAAAIRRGTHAPASAFRTVCDGCREWVGGIFHADPYSKKRLCLGCSAKAGVKGAAEELARREQQSSDAVSRSSRGCAGSQVTGGPNGQSKDVTGRSAPRPGPASTAGAAFFDVLN